MVEEEDLQIMEVQQQLVDLVVVEQTTQEVLLSQV
jgi:hypothetical protein